MNEDQITARLQELTESRDNLKANILAHEGAIQELTSWLERVKENGVKKLEGE